MRKRGDLDKLDLNKYGTEYPTVSGAGIRSSDKAVLKFKWCVRCACIATCYYEDAKFSGPHLLITACQVGPQMGPGREL